MKRNLLGLVVMVAFTAPASILYAQSNPAQVDPTTMPAVAAQPIAFERETLPNGLRVIYAPMNNAPVVHVRVLYHVGSKDEAADRQGFAHMFEHMMFRGSEHVPSEQHMKLIQKVGGVSNAFTSFDQTTYVNTVPNNQLEMALWLEADRMASFKVGDDVLATERNVVKEEWRLRYANQPFGAMSQDLFGLAFKTHNYKWLPIGDMDQLAMAQTSELQDFHDRFYTPNNACLVVAGQFDVEQAKRWVRDYYAWIKPGPAIVRPTRPEEEQTDGPRERTIAKPNLPFARVMMAYKSPAYRSEDHLSLELLTTILGSGRSSRLYQALVANDPVAANASMGNYQLEDPSLVLASFGVLPGKDPAEVARRAREVIGKIAAEGVTGDELAKAKAQARVSIVQAQTNAESVATVLAEEEVFGGDAARANQYFEWLERIGSDDLKRVAGEYLTDANVSVLTYRPAAPADRQAEPSLQDAEPSSRPAPAVAQTEAAAATTAPAVAAGQAMTPPVAAVPGTPPTAGAPGAVPVAVPPGTPMPSEPKPAPGTPPLPEPTPATVPSKTIAEVNAETPLPTTARAARRNVEFPASYPTTAPLNTEALSASFVKGTSQTINGVQVITMTDRRLPVASVTLVVRGGGDATPPEKDGVGSLTAAMLNRGAGGIGAAQLAEEAESRGVSVGASDDGDVTRFTASGMIDQLDFAVDRLKLIMQQPDFPAAEFEKLKAQALQGLTGRLSDPGEVADIKLDESLYGPTHPMGKHATPQTLAAITLDDIKAYYAATYRPENAILVFAGAIDEAQATAMAKKLLDGLPAGAPPKAEYPRDARPRQILVIDNPDGQQAVIRMGVRGYDLSSEDRFAGSIFSQVLSAGIDSRLNRVLRAEKGLTYGAYGYFRPGRNGGAFELSIETKPESVDDAITSTFEVLDRMKKNDIEPAELTEAQQRTAGLMVLETQTIQQQAGRRTDTILNGYPVDYYDNYAKRIAQVTAEQVRAVANKYLADDKTDIIVVGPAAVVEPQLKQFGNVTIAPMPLAEK